MQIIQWLLKVSYESPRETQSSPATKGDTNDEKVTSKDIVLFNNRGARRRLRTAEASKLNCKNFKLFNLLRRRDIAKACFYSTLSLKRLGSNRRRQHWVQAMKMKKESPAHHQGLSTSEKVESAGHVGNTKVLPISDAAVSSSTKDNDHCAPVEKKDKAKSDKKTISRMKELLRWAAAAKSEKGGKYLGRKVLQFRNRATLKSVPDDDQLSNDSPKISFRWDVESCSTTSSAYTALSLASSSKNDQARNMHSLNSTPAHERDQSVARRGNWIHTDSEFVVLEL